MVRGAELRKTVGPVPGGIDRDDHGVAGREGAVAGAQAQRIRAVGRKAGRGAQPVGVAKADRARPTDVGPCYRDRAGQLGKPSSLAVPARVAGLGRVIVWSGPVLGSGAVFVPELGR